MLGLCTFPDRAGQGPYISAFSFHIQFWPLLFPCWWCLRWYSRFDRNLNVTAILPAGLTPFGSTSPLRVLLCTWCCTRFMVHGADPQPTEAKKSRQNAWLVV